MGLLDKAKALANEAVNAGKRVSEVVVEHVETLGERDERVGKAIDKTKAGIKKTRDLASDSFDAAGSHEAGRRAGRAVRKLGEIVSEIPVLSAAVDSIRTYNCVDILAKGVKANPKSMYANLWLSESIIKTSEDMKKYRLVRGVFDPSSFLVIGAAKQVSAFGKEMPSYEKLLRRAWHLASRELKVKSRNPSALDVLARVYLAKGESLLAIKMATAAVLADPRYAVARVTLSRAYFASEQYDKALSWANTAVDAGSTFGYLIAAEVAQLDEVRLGERTLGTRVKNFENLISKVQVSDRVAYAGAYRSPLEAAGVTKDHQIELGKDLWAKAKNSFGKG